MKQFKQRCAALFAIIILMFTSCQIGSVNSADTELNCISSEEFGEVSVILPAGRGWTAAKYKVTASRTGEKSETKETSAANNRISMRLKAGKWSFVAEGYDTKNVVVFRSDAIEGTVAAGKSSSISLLLRQQSAAAKYSFETSSALSNIINKIIVKAKTTAGDEFEISKNVDSLDQTVDLTRLLAGYEYTITADAYNGNVKYATATQKKTFNNVGIFETGKITLNQIQVTEVTANHENGHSFSNADATITLSCLTTGAEIYYTTDGASPSKSSEKYTTPIALFSGMTAVGNKTLKAIAYADGMTESVIFSAEYSFDPNKAASPTFTPQGGTYTTDQTIDLTSSDGGTIKYKIDNGEWLTYSSSISLSGSQTTDVTKDITAYVTGVNNRSDSDPITQTYVVSYPRLNSPTFIPSNENYDTETAFTLSTNVIGAVIYYTTDGSTPTINSIKYTEPLTFNVGTHIVKAIAVADGYKISEPTSWSGEIVAASHDIPVTDINITPTSAELVVGGQSETFTVTYTPADANTDKTIEWSIDDNTVVSLSANGASATVTGLKEGSAVLTATLKSNSSIKKTATLSVTTTTLPPVTGGLGEMHPATGAYSPVDESSWGSTAYTLGANVSGGNTTFALYSANATKVLLEIYDQAYGADAKYDYWMTKHSTSKQWQAKLSGDLTGKMYAFRVWGPNWDYDSSWARGNSSAGCVGNTDYDSSGNRFNPNKVVFDPYAREITHDKSNPDALGAENGGIYGTGAELYNGVVRRNFDTGKYAPKAVVISDSTSYGTKPAIPAKDAIVYEAHARGLTKHPSVKSLSSILSGMDGFEGVENIPDQYRGTYKGATYMVKYLKALGINTIELLPVHESDNDGNLDNSAGGNYWAYMTYGYFAPDRRYSYDKSLGGPTKEFKEMVKAFHDEGMEVYLDVVYNHTGEGGPWYGEGTGEHAGDDFKTCEITSMRGIDNQTYYSLCNTNNKGYWETTGCGNNMQCDNAVVRQFILDSLTYWIDQMGVDGFRFDLAPVLGRVKSGDAWPFNASATTLQQVASLGTSKNVEMIAEAWDIGYYGDGYQVGKFPSGWGEWNGRFRDSIRNYVGNGVRGALNDYINGDYSNFNDQGGPQRSVNFVVAHDGYTLADLCSGYSVAGSAYNGSSTALQWPFGPSDGGDGSAPGSAFGSTAADKRQANRNYTAIQMMSRGVPMIVWGDEFCRTQNGNNNPYNVDSVATWNNYNMINTNKPHLVATGDTSGGTMAYHNNFGTFGNTANVNGNFKFMQYMLNLRKNEPALRQDNYNVGYDFKKEDGTSQLSDDDRCVWIKINGSSVTGGHDYLVFMNMYTEQVSFSIPAAKSGYHWTRVVDTANWAEQNFNVWAESDTVCTYKTADAYGVNGWAVVILKQVSDAPETPTCAAPTISGTTPFDNSTSVTISSADGATIYYTTDGSTPTASSTLYSSPISINKTTTVKAIAVKAGYNNSTVASKKFTKNALTCATPTISGTTPFTDSTTVSISCSSPSGATIYYTIDGAIPTTSSTQYNGSPFTLTETKTVKAIAVYNGYEDSEVATKTFSLKTVSTKSGVMLQGFNWDSAPRSDSSKWGLWYNVMTNNATAIGNTFEYVWCPPPSKTNTSSSEGYGPTEWFNLDNCYGTETQLRAMINAIKPAKAIADVVVNHRDGSTSWGDFTNPTLDVVKGSNYGAICSDDEGFTGEPAYMGKASVRGAADTGAQYAASRDLDHTNVTVQNGIKQYLNQYLKNAGFVGWRYDFVKGFDGYYVGMYNAFSNAEFAVGEYWPGTDDGGGYFSSSNPSGWSNKINNWISRTDTGGYKTRAFDFVLKGMMNDIWGCSYEGGSNSASNNYELLADSQILVNSQPAYAVTFVDNHDTGSTQGHWKLPDSAVPVAYAYILTHPGYPCVAWQHYFTYAESGSNGTDGGAQYTGSSSVGGSSENYTLRQHIDHLINLRKDLGIGYDSVRTTIEATTAHYVAKIDGTNGSVIVEIGYGWSKPSSYSDFEIDCYGNNFCIYTNNSSKCAAPSITFDNGMCTLACNTQGATIKWSTSENGTYSSYSAPFAVTNGQTIWAYATADGLEDSTPTYKTYTAGASISITLNKNGEAATWWWGADAVVYAWVWGNTSAGEWIECSGSGATVNLTVPSDTTGISVVRFASGTATPSWDATIWNRIPDGQHVTYSAGTTTYTSNVE